MAPAPADMLAHRRPRMSVGQKHVGVQVESCFDDTDHFTETIHSIEVDENEAPVTHSTPRHLLPVFATVSPSKSFWKFSQAADKRLMELEESVHMHEKQRELYLRRIEDLEDELQAYKMRFDKAQNWLTATTSNGLYQNVAEAKILPVPPQRIIHEDSSFTAFSNSKKLLMGLLDPPVSDGSWPVTSDGDVLPGAWAADVDRESAARHLSDFNEETSNSMQTRSSSSSTLLSPRAYTPRGPRVTLNPKARVLISL
mmetsp:Transcript_23553/g.76735  ORF Transcript_23553/g.76735 Transcript_23553/m.76735 type:complete len:255 (-) Transcript_23553:1009-1773(-)